MYNVAYTGNDGFVRVVVCEDSAQERRVREFIEKLGKQAFRAVKMSGDDFEGSMGNFGL